MKIGLMAKQCIHHIHAPKLEIHVLVRHKVVISQFIKIQQTPYVLHASHLTCEMFNLKSATGTCTR